MKTYDTKVRGYVRYVHPQFPSFVHLVPKDLRYKGWPVFGVGGNMGPVISVVETSWIADPSSRLRFKKHNSR